VFTVADFRRPALLVMGLAPVRRVRHPMQPSQPIRWVPSRSVSAVAGPTSALIAAVQNVVGPQFDENISILELEKALHSVRNRMSLPDAT
jgi:hypothetical protein